MEGLSPSSRVVDLDSAVLRGATIEQALAELGETLDADGVIARVRGRVIAGSHRFVGPARGVLRFELVRGRRNGPRLAFRAPDGGSAFYDDGDGADPANIVHFSTAEQLRERVRDPEVRARLLRMGLNPEAELARAIARPTLIAVEIDPGTSYIHRSAIGYQAANGRLEVSLRSVWAEGPYAPRGNAAISVERLDPTEFLYRCSPADAPEPDFDGLVCKLTVIPAS